MIDRPGFRLDLAIETAAETRVAATRMKDVARERRASDRDSVTELSEHADRAMSDAHRLLDAAIDRQVEKSTALREKVRSMLDETFATKVGAAPAASSASDDYAPTPVAEGSHPTVSYTVPHDDLVAAFDEWNRRRAEWPELFTDDGDPADGRSQVEYLLEILAGNTDEWHRSCRRFSVALNAAAWAIQDPSGTAAVMDNAEVETVARRVAARVLDAIAVVDRSA
jgi:hypothetical protein